MLSEHNPDFLHSVQSDEYLPPVSRWTTLGGLVLLGAVGTAFTVAAITKYNVVVKSPATVRPSGEIRIAQAATEGTIRTIAVKENQVVKPGDIIATLDDTQLQTKKSQYEGNIQQNKLQLLQLDAQIRALDGQMTAENDRSSRAVASAEADLSRTQRDYEERKVASDSELQEAEANIRIAQNELQKAQSELIPAQANVNATIAALGTATARYNRYKSIPSESISKNQFEEAQLEVARLSQALESQKASIESQKQVIERQKQAVEAALARRNRALAGVNPSGAIVSMATQKIAQERAASVSGLARLNQERQSLLQRKIEVNSLINNARKELKQVETELQKTKIRATEAGTILKLELRNSSQVVRPGEALAQISPSNAPLIIKARVASDDVSKVKVCKTKNVVDCQEGKVHMRVSAYSYPDYGTLKGAVRGITADAITPQNNGDTPVAPYYEVTIEAEKLYLERGSQQYPIQPGMEITADIISKEETVLTFILRKARLLTDL